MQPRHRRFAPMARTFPSIIFLLAVPAVLAGGERKHSSDASLFSEAEYRTHLTYLASDELEGRGTGQVGIDRAADYIAEEFKKYGVKPAGDDDTYFQNFNLQLDHELGVGTRLAYGRNGRKMRIPLKLHDEYIPFPFSASKSFEGDVVFAGYGIVDDENHYNDYEGLDVTDKVVLIIRRAPEFAEFSPMQHQSFRAKASRANVRGAAAILIVNRSGDGEEGLYPFDQGARGFGPASYGVPMIHLTEEAANRLLDSANMPTISDLQKQIEDEKRPASKELTGVTIRGKVDIQPIDSPVRKRIFVGMIPGQGPQSKEIIVLGAHYDHLGIRNKGEPTFDSTKDISNGADDNGSGTTLVMAMAKAYTEGPAPNRSILLILFTGEELGLLGSAHFAKHPTVDLSDCVAMLNFDMVGRLKNNRLEVGGMRTGDGFEETVKTLAERYDMEIRDGGGGRGPSDHTNFYNKKIPVLFFFTGIHRQYHKPDDDTGLINFEGAIRIARYSADIIDAIDSNPERPAYHDDTRRASIGRQPEDDDKADRSAKANPRNPDSASRQGDGDRRPARRGVQLGVVPDLDNEDGLIVSEVNEASPAARAGVKPGDQIVRIGKINIGGVDDAVEALSKLDAGDKTSLGILRDGRTIELKVSFAKPEDASRPASSEVRILRTVEKIVKEAIEKSEQAERFKYKLSVKDKTVTVQLDAPDSESACKLTIELSLRFMVVAKFEEGYKINLELGGEGGDSGLKKFKVNFRLSTADRASSKDGAKSKSDTRESQNPHAAPRAKQGEHGHGDGGDVETRETMPSVRLGIMPTYGETEGEGYEIDGVTEGGPAARAGMKDGDRIYTIGDKKITNVYEYMDALRKYKPGDEIPVVVIREGKKIDLKVKAGGPKAEPN